jgi:hypothetical protein
MRAGAWAGEWVEMEDEWSVVRGGGIGRSCLLRDWLGVLSRVFCGCEILFAGLRDAPPVSRMRLFPGGVLVAGGVDISQCSRRVESEVEVEVEWRWFSVGEGK